MFSIFFTFIRASQQKQFFLLILVKLEKWYKQEKLSYWCQDFFFLVINRASMSVLYTSKHFKAESCPSIPLLTSIPFQITGRCTCTNSSVGSWKSLKGGPSIAEHWLLFIAQPCVISQPSFLESSQFFRFPSILICFFLIPVLLLYHFSLIHSGFNLEQKSFLMFEHVFDVTCCCTFHKHTNFEVQKPNDNCVFRCCQSSWQTS